MSLNFFIRKNKNRCKFDIVRDMLSIAMAKVRKTKIMYQANLSFRQVEKYLKYLVESGLLYYGNDSRYLITERGKDFLQIYNNYIERCGRIKKEAEGAAEDRRVLESMCFNNENSDKRALTKEVHA